LYFLFGNLTCCTRLGVSVLVGVGSGMGVIEIVGVGSGLVKVGVLEFLVQGLV
jgi:hypothetical protein